MTASPARRNLLPVPARPLLDPGIRRVAIVRLRVGLSDLLASVPALRALKRARPDVQVSMITWSEVASVVDRMSDYVDELFPFPGYPGIPDRSPRLSLLPAFLDEARRRGFDLALQMYGAHAAANEVTSRLGARVIGGFFTPGLWDADLSTHLPYPLREHEIRRHLLLMEFLGAPAGSSRLEFPVRPRDETERARLAAEHFTRAVHLRLRTRRGNRGQPQVAAGALRSRCGWPKRSRTSNRAHGSRRRRCCKRRSESHALQGGRSVQSDLVGGVRGIAQVLLVYS